MNKYKYRAMDEEGRSVRGSVSAVNDIDLYQQLKSIGLELLDCKPERQTKFALPFANSIKARDLIQAYVHMEQMQRSGVPLLETIADIRDSTDSPKLRDVFVDIHRNVSEGSSLSQAMQKHPKVFDNIAIAITASSEETGNLADAFSQLIVFKKWSDMMRRRTIKALTYPLFTLLVFMGVLSLLMMFTVPKIIGFLRNIGEELPPITRALIATSDFLQDYGLYVIATPFAIAFFIKTMCRVSPGFRYNWDQFVLRLPVIGEVVRKLNLSRFSRTFGSLFKSGLEILKCMDVAIETVGNVYMKQMLGRAKRQISDGSSISGAMNNTGEFPSLVVRMVKIGEESGNISHVLDQVSEFYDSDVDEAVQRMIGMITPALTIILGGIIMWIAAGVFGPIYGVLGKVGA